MTKKLLSGNNSSLCQVYLSSGGMLQPLEQEFFKSQAAHLPFLDLLMNFTMAHAA
jgi:hypothetical protein